MQWVVMAAALNSLHTAELGRSTQMGREGGRDAERDKESSRARERLGARM